LISRLIICGQLYVVEEFLDWRSQEGSWNVGTQFGTKKVLVKGNLNGAINDFGAAQQIDAQAVAGNRSIA